MAYGKTKCDYFSKIVKLRLRKVQLRMNRDAMPLFWRHYNVTDKAVISYESTQLVSKIIFE